MHKETGTVPSLLLGLVTETRQHHNQCFPLELVCVFGVWNWCVCLAFGTGVCVWLLELVCVFGVWNWCVCLAFGTGVCVSGVWDWCVCVWRLELVCVLRLELVCVSGRAVFSVWWLEHVKFSNTAITGSPGGEKH